MELTLARRKLAVGACCSPALNRLIRPHLPHMPARHACPFVHRGVVEPIDAACIPLPPRDGLCAGFFSAAPGPAYAAMGGHEHPGGRPVLVSTYLGSLFATVLSGRALRPRDCRHVVFTKPPQVCICWCCSGNLLEARAPDRPPRRIAS